MSIGISGPTQNYWMRSTSYSADCDRVGPGASAGPPLPMFMWDMIGSLPEIASEQTGSGTALRTYLYWPQGRPLDHDAVWTSYLYQDPLGSITDSTSSTGRPVAVLLHAYGNPISSTDVGGSSSTEPLRVAGQYLDFEFGQYDMRAREYDPGSMRFDSQIHQALDADFTSERTCTPMAIRRSSSTPAGSSTVFRASAS